MHTTIVSEIEKHRIVRKKLKDKEKDRYQQKSNRNLYTDDSKLKQEPQVSLKQGS